MSCINRGAANDARADDPFRKILLPLSWIHTVLLFANFYLLAAAAFASEPAAAADILAGCLWLGFPTVLSWIFLRRIRLLPAYLLCSAAVCTLTWAFSHSALTAVLAVSLFLIRGYTRIRQGKIRREMLDMPGDAGDAFVSNFWEIPTFLDQPHPLHWTVFALTYAGILLAERYDMLSWCLFLLLAEIFICFLFRYLQAMQNFISENQKIANLPSGTIRKVGGVLLFIGIIFLSLAALPSVLYRREPLIGLMRSLRDIPGEPSDAFLTAPAQTGGFDAAALAKLLGSAAKPPVWLNLLLSLLTYACAAVCAALLLFFLYRVCRSAAQYFAQSEEEEILFLGTEEQDGVQKNKRPAGVRKERRSSPNQKIRRIYKRTIRRAMSERPVGSETPTELESKAALAQDPGREILHELYEKARYSEDGCTAEDAKRLM